jgi:hypothetical protein
VVPRHAGGGDQLDNLQAISLASHRAKSNTELVALHKMRSMRGHKRRTSVRRNGRYWLRNSRALVYYRR